MAARPAALGTPPLRGRPGIQGSDRGGCSLALPSRITRGAPGPSEAEGAGIEVFALVPSQAGGEGAQNKVIAPGLAPLGAAGAAAVVNMFVLQPRPSPPQESLPEACRPPATSTHLLGHQDSSYCPNWTGI